MQIHTKSVLVTVLALAATLAEASAQPSLNPVYTFQGGSDGANPLSGLTSDGNGNYFGVISTPGSGAVFELSTVQPGTDYSETLIYSFGKKYKDGVYPVGPLTSYGGKIYGVTSSGGTYGDGVVFSLEPPSKGVTWVEHVLHSFDGHSGSVDGGTPNGGLVFGADGSLYGTTIFGGSEANESFGGTVFTVSSTGKYKVIYNFSGIVGNSAAFTPGGEFGY